MIIISNILNLVEEFKRIHNTKNEYNADVYKQSIVTFVDHVIRLKNNGYESTVIARILITIYNQKIFSLIDTGRSDLQSFVTRMIEMF